MTHDDTIQAPLGMPGAPCDSAPAAAGVHGGIGCGDREVNTAREESGREPDGAPSLCEWGVDWKALAIERAAEVAALNVELGRLERSRPDISAARSALAGMAQTSPLAGMTDETLTQIAGSHSPSSGAARALLDAREILGGGA